MSKIFKRMAAQLAQDNKAYPPVMAPQKVDGAMPEGCIAVWRSSRFLAQIYAPKDGAQRVSINRTAIDIATGRWIDGITWEEIQEVKRQIGFADRMAVEIYPEQSSIVNVANMRHIWLVDPLPFAWGRQ